MAELIEAIPLLEAGDWQAAHLIVQAEESTAGSWGHGIVHLLEGDLANARFWYERAGREFPEPSLIAEEIAALKQHLSS